MFGKNIDCLICVLGFCFLIDSFYIIRFCNKRQALKNSAKKFKTTQINEDNESTTSSLMEDKFIDTTEHLNGEEV